MTPRPAESGRPGESGRPSAPPPAQGSDVDTEVHSFETTQQIPVITDGGRPLTVEEEAAVQALPSGSALLILNHGSASGERFLIDKPSTTVGRHPTSDIFLDDITVSREHAVFTRAADAVAVRDLGSLNGTYVNRRSIEAETTLAAGDEVMIGKFRLVFFPSEHGIS